MFSRFKALVPKSLKPFLRQLLVNLDLSQSGRLFRKYSYFTMIPKQLYKENLKIVEGVKNIKGDVVECGTWRGGMIAGIAELLGKERNYHLYDSFEGLPPAREIDGGAAMDWQKDTSSSLYYDNCTADIKDAERAMELAGVRYECIKGWFDDTVPNNKLSAIALLRLDGDWYDSTMVCLKNFYPKVVTGGIIIIDDYPTWDGCSRAVHDYLSSIQSKSRINWRPNGVAYIVKQD